MNIETRQKLRKALQLVGETRVFKGLYEKELELFVTSLRCVKFDAGDLLLEEGTPMAGLNIVLSGSVEVFLPGVADAPASTRVNRVTLANLKRGDCFGEYAIFDDKPASASVVGMRPGTLIYIDKERFRAVLSQNDTIARKIYHNLLQIMVERLRASDRDFDVLLSNTG